MPVRHMWPALLALLSGVGIAMADQPPSAAFVEMRNLLSSTLEDCATKRRSTFQRPPSPLVVAKPGSYYPSLMQSMGNQAIVLLEMLIDSAGNPRFVHAARVLSNREDAAFTDAAVSWAHASTWSPGLSGGEPASGWMQMKLKFILYGSGPMGNILSESALREEIDKAAKGDAKAIAIVSYLHSVAASEVALTTAEQYDYLATSALNGERAAALRVAQLLSSPACIKPPLVLTMLTRQAMSGYSAAEMVLAGELMEANDPSTYERIAPLLHGAANSLDPFTALWATGLLATAPADALRDPAFALSNAKQFNHTDPDTLETLAAAQAANGNFEEAVKLERQAIDAAGRWKWKLDELQKRLATYQSGKPWTGYLCDCQQLVPGEGI